jgi:hypothetical protein
MAIIGAEIANKPHTVKGFLKQLHKIKRPKSTY